VQNHTRILLRIGFPALIALAGCTQTREGLGPEGSGGKPIPPPLEVANRTVTEDGTVVAKLSNGLTVIVKAVRTAPVVTVHAYVGAGSMYEGRWLGCGLSHLTEHLVAKGAVHDMGEGQTAKEAKQISDRVAEIGGQSNASTSLDHTRYYISAAAGKTMDCIDLIADWMARPDILPEDFEREHGVVQRELELREDNPRVQFWHTHMRNVYRTHPAAVPIVGYAEPLRKVTREDVLAYHRKMYVPQNMVFAVVGDVDVGAVLERVRGQFASFEAGRAPDLALPPVEPLAGTRRVIKPHKEFKEVLQEMGFQTIPLVHEDLYALDVLSFILTKGRASRLVQKILREKKLVTTISSGSWTPHWGRGEFSIWFRTSPDKPDAAEKAILAELEAIVADGVTPDELERAKRQKIAAFVNSQQTVESIAGTLASDYLSTGDAGFSRSYTRQIQDVTGKQVHAVARKYFTFDRMAVTRMVPAKDFAVTGGGQESAEQSQTTFFTLPNGLRVVLHPTNAIGLVAMTLATEGGLLLETEKTNGLGTLMAALSTKGAGKRSAEQIAQFFAQAGGRLKGSCGNNSFYWEGKVLDDSFGEALEIFADVIQRPTFSDKELDILRPLLLQQIERTDHDLLGQAFQLARRGFFTGSPYHLPSKGSKKVVASASREQIADWHGKHLRAGSSVLAVFGNFDPAAARKQIERLFAAIPAGKVALDIPPARVLPPAGELHVAKTEKTGAAVLVFVPGMKADNLDDRFAITVLDTIISGYHLPSGWLHTELRGKQLVYVVHAYNFAGLAPGAFITYAAGQPEKAPEVIEIIKKNLRKAATYKPSQKEIDLAVNTILTAELLGNQSLPALAMSAALDEMYGFGYDFRKKLEPYYRKVTPEEVLRVGRKYFSGEFFVLVTTPKPKDFGGKGKRIQASNVGD